MGRMKDLYLDFLKFQEYPQDSPVTREEWELRHKTWKLLQLQKSKLLEKEGEEDNGN